MSDTTIETPHSLGPEGRQPSPEGQSADGRDRPFIRRHVWWIVGIGIVVFSIIVVRWANTRPGYDPYGWLVWGYQLLHWNLNLGGAPSWKPLPLLATAPFALFGHNALYLWMVLSVAVSFSGTVFAGRIAYRVVNRRRPPPCGRPSSPRCSPGSACTGSRTTSTAPWTSTCITC